jgi:hypothetical protein
MPSYGPVSYLAFVVLLVIATYSVATTNFSVSQIERVWLVGDAGNFMGFTLGRGLKKTPQGLLLRALNLSGCFRSRTWRISD